MLRRRSIYAACLAGVVALGLLSRSPSAECLPEFVQAYAGDTLWALMVFLVFSLVFRRAGTVVIMFVALTFCYAIEVSQCVQTSWLSAVRDTRLGGLVLGYGFKWTDLVCYLVGVLAGAAVELGVCRLRLSSRDTTSS